MEECLFLPGNPAYVMKGIHFLRGNPAYVMRRIHFLRGNPSKRRKNKMVYTTHVYINALAWNENGEQNGELELLCLVWLVLFNNFVFWTSKLQ